jgi:hypothetical protein
MLDDSVIRRKRALATARMRRWRAKHAEVWKAYCREYRKRPNAQATHKAYRAKNREHLNAKARAHRQANLKTARAKAREQRRRQRERELAAMAADPTFEPRRLAYMRDYGKKYRAQNPEKIREWAKRAREKRKAK